MDQSDILKLAKRTRTAGLQIQLSFHYSDYWTNGAKLWMIQKYIYTLYIEKEHQIFLI
ncbi:glycosyl hydrolase 53 family protein [Paenibacillus sp. FSL K6-3182]|uniref:glycosyl hydrolase 53 family protein n=1 Tax=unclassified Paenibacillus TaxID=185978 RepID=UPI0030CACAFA